MGIWRKLMSIGKRKDRATASEYIARILKDDWKHGLQWKEIAIQLPDKEIRFAAKRIVTIIEYEGWLYIFLGEPGWERYFINISHVVSISYCDTANC